MKRILLVGLVFIISFTNSTIKTQAQTLQDVFTSEETAMIYLGVDFTKAKIINQSNISATDFKTVFAGSINDVIVNEAKKYNFADAFRKSSVGNDLTAVKKHNATINLDELHSSDHADFSRLKESDIKTVVSELALPKKNAIGILFVMEGMKKEDKKGAASLWIVLIDLKSGSVLMTERMEEPAVGIGVRNYWASVVAATIEDIDKSKYKSWRSKYTK